MPQNSETRIRKNNTLEEFRQKSNDISLDVGDNKLIDSRILDKTLTFTASADQAFFESGSMRYEYKSDETLDDTTHQISNPVGRVRVYNGSTEYSQALSGSNTFKTPLYVANIALTGSPTLTEFVENTVVYQAASAQTDLTASAVTFQGKILGASVADGIRLKTDSGTYNTNAALRVHPGTSGRSVSTNTITSSQHTGKTSIDGTYGRLIQINAGNVNSGDVIKIVSHSLVDAINEVQDDVGDITSLNTNSAADIVQSINELEVGIRGTSNNLVAAALTTTANDLLAGINELDAEIGNVSTIDDESGYSATTLVGGITELQDHLGTKANLTTTAKGDLVLAINEVDANADASAKLVSSSTQTFNSNLVFGTSGKTFTFNSGTTLDLSQASLVIGAGGENLAFNTAFLALTANDNSNSAVNRLGLEVRRAGSGADAKLQWNEVDQVSSNPARAWQLVGLNDSGASNTADIVTFYNAKELFSNNTETGVAVNWQADTQNFDINLDADPTIQLSGDIGGSVTLSDLQTATYTLATTIQAGSVENSMLAGSISQDKLAGSIANAKLVNSSFELDADSGTTNSVNLGETMTLAGTSGEVTTAVSGNTVTFGLPNDVVIGNDLTVTGDLVVQGDTVTLNTSTLQVEDTLVLLGASSTLPTTGGFGLETRLFSGRANQTINNRTWSSTGKHPNAASNVTGSHSIVFNFGYDPGGGAPKGRWEMDGSPLLSSATVGSPQIEGQNFSTGDNLVFTAGTGLSESVSLSSGTHTVTFTNTDLGSSQNIFKNVSADSGTNAVADSNDDTLNIAGGTALATVGDASNDRITINHSDVGAGAATYGQTGSEDGQYIKSIIVNAQGHVTNVTSDDFDNRYDNFQNFTLTADSGGTSTISSGESIDIAGGTGISTSINTTTDDVTIALDSISGLTAGSYGGSLTPVALAVNAQGQITSIQNGSSIQGTGLISVAANGTISTGADNYDHFGVNLGGNITSGSASGVEDIGSNDTLVFAGGAGIEVSRNSKTITILNTSQNSDTNTVLNLQADTGGATSFSGNSSNTVTIAGGTGIDTSRSGDSITATLDLNELTTSSTQGDADFFAVVNSSGSQFKMAPGSIPLSLFDNTATGFTNNTGTLTNIINGTGISVSGSNTQPTVGMTGDYTGTFTVTGEIRATGDVVAFYSSDERLKDNKSVIENSLDKVGKLKGYEFDWNDKQELYEGHDVGVIAQEVEKVLPEVVQTRDDGYKAVKYDKLVPLLINAINELKAEIEELKSINKKV